MPQPSHLESGDRHPGCARDEPEGCEECFLLARGVSTDPANIEWAKQQKAQRYVDRLFEDDAAWQRTIVAVQGEVFKSTIGNTEWEMPDDIAEDVICAVINELAKKL